MDAFPTPVTNAMLVIAHPDDESMFFVPLLYTLVANLIPIHVLCLSTGNYDGLGAIRKKELDAACQVLGIPTANVHCIDDETRFADGPIHEWSAAQVASTVQEHVSAHAIDTIFTFDAYGVSGHTNHKSVHRGVMHFLQQSASRRVNVYVLETTDIVRKYAGIVEYPVSWLWGRRSNRVVLFAPSWTLSYKAMAAHASQFVWFRKLFVGFSRYTTTNTLILMEPEHKRS
jgi:N-acetylglucosaminylphosphatidylinositol deacetylase